MSESKPVSLEITMEAALNAAFHMAVKAPSGELRARITSAIVREMLPHVSHLPVSARITHRVVTVADLDLFKAYVAGREEEVRRVDLSNDFDTQKLAREMDVEFLLFVDEFARQRIFREDILISAALERDDLELFLAVTRKSSRYAPFTDDSNYQCVSAINYCGPRVAPELTRRLRGALAEKAPIVEEMRRDYFSYYDLKAVVALARAGLDLSAASVDDEDGSADEVRKVVQMSSSAHGRMEIAGLEPDLEALMGRPKLGEFCGLSVTPKPYSDR